MIWLKRAINRWLSEYEPRTAPVDVSPRFHHASHGMQFTAIKANNGWILQAYDYSKDMPMYWVIPEDTSIGAMIDTVMVESRLAK